MKHFLPSRGGRFTLAALVLLLTTTISRGQNAAWQALVGVGNSTVTAGPATVDDAGNAYVTGTFTGSLRVGTTLLNSAGDKDIFVAKWIRSTNSFAWAQRGGGTGADQVLALAVTPRGVYVAGYFRGNSAVFGNLALNSAGATDGFVAKLLDTGASANFDWARPIGGPGSDYIQSLSVAGSEVYVAGGFSGTLTYAGRSYSSMGGNDGFVASLSENAFVSYGWFAPIGGALDDAVTGVACNGTSVYAVGRFQGTAVFGGNSLTSLGGYDAFVAKIADAVVFPVYGWVRQGGSAFVQDEAGSVAVEGSNIYVGGVFGGTARFGPVSLASAGGFDAFLVKLVDAGSGSTFAWGQRVGGSGNDVVTSVATRSGAVYVAGRFEASATGLGAASLTSIGASDVFAARLTDAGNSASVDWVQQAGGAGPDDAASITVPSQGRVYVSGTVSTPATFGSIILNDATNSSVGFLASINDNITLATAAPSTGPLSFYPNPARTTVQLPAASAATRLTLLDNLGRAVRQGSGTQLSVLGVAPGLYILQAATPGQPVRTARLVVE